MPEHRVTFITLSSGGSRHEHITHIGGAGWKITKEDAISRIEGKTDSFYVYDDRAQKRANVGVVREAGRAPFLRTHADGYWNDNLLSLPRY